MAKRAAKGAGSVYQRGGVWYGTITDGKTESGKQKRVVVARCRTKSEAQKLVNEAVYHRDHGEAVKLSSKNAGAYFKYWLEEVKRPGCKSTATWAWYHNIVHNHLMPEFGSYQLKDITKPVIQRYLNQMSREEKPKYRTIKGIRDTLRQIYDEALQDKLVRGNPVMNVVLPVAPKKSKKEEFKAFTPELRTAILSAAEDDTIMDPILNFLMWNGARIGEALALDWQCVDFEKHTIQIVQATQRQYDDARHYEQVIGACKTESSVRENYMPEILEHKLTKWQDYLRSQPNGEALIAPDAPVFPSTRTWKRRTYSGFRSSYRHFLERNGLPTEHMNLHRYRHTAATMMLEVGINPRVVQEELGHSDIKTTLGTYSHVIRELHQDVAEKKDEMYAAMMDNTRKKTG